MQVLVLALALAQWFHVAHAFGFWQLFDSPAPTSPHNFARRDSNDTSADSKDSSATSGTKSAKSSVITSSLSIDPNLPAGGIAMQTPKSTSTTYIKAGDTVTFQWNYTSLIATPKAINIEAVCTQNSQTYTIAHNQSAKSTSVHWDTNDVTDEGGLHLITAEYTLVIYDSSSSPSAVGSAGMLSPFQYTFGIYLPQKYTPWPQNAKYVNAAIILARPTVMASVLAAVSVGLLILV